MSKGFVYVLTNPCMPGIVKIGKTTRSAAFRAAELYQTGVPTPFEVYCAMGEITLDELKPALQRSHDAMQRRLFEMHSGVPLNG